MNYVEQRKLWQLRAAAFFWDRVCDVLPMSWLYHYGIRIETKPWAGRLWTLAAAKSYGYWERARMKKEGLT